MARTAAQVVAILILLVATGCRAAVPATPSPSGLPSLVADGSAPTPPADFPIMPGATPVSGVGLDPGVIGMWTVETDGARVYDFYVAALPAAGFSIVGLYPGGSVAIIRFQHAVHPVLKLAITSAPSGTATEIRLSRDAP